MGKQPTRVLNSNIGLHSDASAALLGQYFQLPWSFPAAWAWFQLDAFNRTHPEPGLPGMPVLSIYALSILGARISCHWFSSLLGTLAFSETGVAQEVWARMVRALCAFGAGHHWRNGLSR